MVYSIPMQPLMQPMSPGMMQPGMMQPGTMQPGMMQPGMMQPGMMQPGTMQPGMMQPGMMQPGMMQPGMMMSPWNGSPPPKDSAPTWFGMYKPDEGWSKIGPDGRFTRGSEGDDCGNCLYSFCCPSCAAGETAEWASDGATPAWCGCLNFACCAPCAAIDVRKQMVQKIYGYHQQRGGARKLTLSAPAPALSPLWARSSPPRCAFPSVV